MSKFYLYKFVCALPFMCGSRSRGNQNRFNLPCHYWCGHSRNLDLVSGVFCIVCICIPLCLALSLSRSHIQTHILSRWLPYYSPYSVSLSILCLVALYMSVMKTFIDNNSLSSLVRKVPEFGSSTPFILAHRASSKASRLFLTK